MEAMAQEWTDGRLDELSHRVHRGFEQMNGEFNSIRAEINGVRAEISGVRGEIGGVRAEIGDVRAEIHGVQRTLVFGSIAMISAIITGFAAIVSQV
jgi:hypothetical protein